tara:strand:+ start:618 stop:1061 length:444 start_codon:yes stop_codon:yes gene_type:complete
VLEEIAAANKAFATIKSALQNGREFYDVSESCATYFNCKSIIARRSKKNGKKSQLQNFLELEKLRKQEEWIREWMIYSGRAGLYDDWLKFQSQCKKVRASEERAKKQSDEAIANQLLKWFKYMGGAIATLFSILVAVMDFLQVTKGE